MARGRRYDKEPKLNIKKVFGVAIAFIVFIMISNIKWWICDNANIFIFQVITFDKFNAVTIKYLHFLLPHTPRIHLL